MSTIMTPLPLPYSDSAAHEQTNQPAPSLPPSNSSADVPQPPSIPNFNYEFAASGGGESPHPVVTTDVMDHEPTSNQPDRVLRPDINSPTLPPENNVLQQHQGIADSPSIHQASHQPESQPVQSGIRPAPTTAMEPAPASQTPQPASRPMMVPVRPSARDSQSQHGRNGIAPATVQSPTNQAQNPPTPAANSGTHSESEESMGDEEETDNESDSDRDWLEDMVEDLSSPSVDELANIERSKEISALDHPVWESRVYKKLGDPELIPQPAAMITWTLKGFHGTPDAPNKQRIMRSPSVEIGGLLFNIKVFPKGNEGTDHLSVYIECTGPACLSNSASIQNGNSDSSSSQKTSQGDHRTGTTTITWEVAAQVGCIMYNPREPRVHKFEQASHRFENNNTDWGWVRFCGPWKMLHLRKHNQRAPMLQNDELAFQAYVRTIHDPTRALWWQPAEGIPWNSLRKTGLRAIDGNGSARQAVAAALVPWLHLNTFRMLLTAACIPRLQLEPHRRPWPMFECLYRVLQQKNHGDRSDDTVCLSQVEDLLHWYDAGLSESTDVVEIWENIRSILNHEYHAGQERLPDQTHKDVLQFIKTYRVNYEPKLPVDLPVGWIQRQRSTQEIFNDLFKERQDTYLEWEGYCSNGKGLPSVLQLELCRQRYDRKDRTWKRLTHRIKIDPHVKVKDHQYDLFGLIISRGKLGSGRTYAIVRSSDITSQWARYKAGTVSLLTTQQAIRCHEGEALDREGEESVAQVLIYLRANRSGSNLPAKRPFPYLPVMTPLAVLPTPLRKPAEPLATLPVVIHFAAAFEGHEGPGVVDPYRPVIVAKTGIELTSHFNSESTIESVENYMRAMRGDDMQIKCSALEWSPPPRYKPPRPQKRAPMDKLGQICPGSPRIHLWANCNFPTGEIDSNLVQPGQITPKRVFVKFFNPSQRHLAGLLSFIAVKDVRLGDYISPTKTLRKPLAIFMESLDGYQVHATKLTWETLVSDEEIYDNCILILMAQLDASEQQHEPALDSENSLQLYYARQRNLKHFAYKGSIYRRSYFGGPYARAELQDGIINGFGTLVQTNGDYYHGCLRSGLKHGDGKMYYANGDTYFGKWSANERSGWGKMVYHSTGNVYIGEWCNGRRHGSGTMTFKKADEQLAICHICYCNEIDALFYRCGHILACESCARQCKDCPVCRKPVDAVVKIYDMRREGV